MNRVCESGVQQAYAVLAGEHRRYGRLHVAGEDRRQVDGRPRRDVGLALGLGLELGLDLGRQVGERVGYFQILGTLIPASTCRRIVPAMVCRSLGRLNVHEEYPPSRIERTASAVIWPAPTYCPAMYATCAAV